MKSAFISDGYDRNGYFAETEFYPPVRFTYRPATIKERMVIKDKIGRETELRGVDSAERLFNAWLVEKLKDWDVTDEGGHKVPITADNLGKLAPAFAFRLQAVLLGDGLCDPDPKTGEQPINEDDASKN